MAALNFLLIPRESATDDLKGKPPIVCMIRHQDTAREGVALAVALSGMCTSGIFTSNDEEALVPSGSGREASPKASDWSALTNAAPQPDPPPNPADNQRPVGNALDARTLSDVLERSVAIGGGACDIVPDGALAVVHIPPTPPTAVEHHDNTSATQPSLTGSGTYDVYLRNETCCYAPARTP